MGNGRKERGMGERIGERGEMESEKLEKEITENDGGRDARVC